MKANYKQTAHSKTKIDLYNQIAELFFVGVSFFCADKMGFSNRKIYAMLQYIQGLIETLNGNELRFKDLKIELAESYGIHIDRNDKGIKIKLDEVRK